MPIRVTVVVPVYNPGVYLDRCASSMLAQTLPADQLEVIFVDDGSTDDSPASIDALADKHPQFRVIHTPNSGWPGRPRNIGIDEARGEYIQFLDQDDAMAPEALERMHEMATRSRSDIVIGKVASDFRGVPHSVFRRNRETCSIHNAPLIDSLTPHKMFRTAFLRDTAIRFPEGRRRLEDQLFMVRAYFSTERVSILSDVLCYFYMRRADGGNAGSQGIVPRGYYANLREVLDVVLENTAPGEFRDRLFRRFYRVEVLGRLSEPSYPERDAATRAQLFEAAHELATTVFDSGIHDGLASVLQMRSSLLRAGRSDGLLVLAQRLGSVRLSTAVEVVEWMGDVLEVRFTAQLVDDTDGAPVTLLRRDDEFVLEPALTKGVTDDPIVMRETPEAWRVEVTIRDPSTGEEWSVPARVEVDAPDDRGPDGVRIRPVLRVLAKVAPGRLAGGRPLHAAAWRLHARLVGAGLDRSADVAGPLRSADMGVTPALLGHELQVVIPRIEVGGALLVDVGRRTTTLGEVLSGRKVIPLPGDGRWIQAQLAAVGTAERPSWVVLTVRAPGGDRRFDAMLRTRRGHAVVVGRARGARLPEGRHPLLAHLDGSDGPALPLGDVDIDGRGRVHLVGGRRISPLESLARRIGESLDPGARARRLRHRVPAPVRRALRRVWRVNAGR